MVVERAETTRSNVKLELIPQSIMPTPHGFSRGYASSQRKGKTDSSVSIIEKLLDLTLGISVIFEHLRILLHGTFSFDDAHLESQCSA